MLKSVYDFGSSVCLPNLSNFRKYVGIILKLAYGIEFYYRTFPTENVLCNNYSSFTETRTIVLLHYGS